MCRCRASTTSIQTCGDDHLKQSTFLATLLCTWNERNLSKFDLGWSPRLPSIAGVSKRRKHSAASMAQAELEKVHWSQVLAETCGFRLFPSRSVSNKILQKKMQWPQLPVSVNKSLPLSFISILNGSLFIVHFGFPSVKLCSGALVVMQHLS